MSQLPQEQASAKVEAANKKVYSKPELKKYGSLSKLTRKTGALGDKGGTRKGT